MSRQGTRQIVFVCSGVSTAGELISKIIPTDSANEASALFLKQHAVDAQVILGPFYKKRTRILESSRVLKFSKDKVKKAIYNDWVVNAFALIEPADHAYLVFIKRADDKKIPAPKGTITAPISDLRFLDDK